MSLISSSRRPARKQQRPKGTLALLFAMVLALLGGIFATTVWATPAGQWAPKLGLDLEGGRQIILEPEIGEGQTINSQQVEQAVDIIRRRVDGSGVAEAEVTTLGERNIVVSIPGEPSETMLESLSRSSQLMFRAVIASQPNQPPEITLPTPPEAPKATSSPKASPSSSAGGGSQVEPNASRTGANGAYPEAYPAATTAPGGASAAESPSPKPSPTKKAPKKKGPTPSDTSWGTRTVSAAWVKTGIVDKGATYQDLLTAYDCGKAELRDTASRAPKTQPVVMCDEDGATKYLMGPTEVDGTMVETASSGPETNQQGAQTGGTQINLEFDDKGKAAFGAMTARLAKFGQQTDQNKSAIIIDGQVISALGTTEPIRNGEARITGGFTAESGKTLSDQLKFGALPFSFNELTNDQISPQLGQDQLNKGIIAGVIGLVLVVIYSLFQYRTLGLVTVASLAIAGLLTYGSIVLLGHLANFRLTMAGVTGLIVAIGFTADSFIVYFERVRDEVRSGRPLRAAVETGWGRARRTIIISDVVNFMAAAILYVLSESNVKAFAFTLGLTTVIDIVVVMLFTHPALTLLARTKFFGGGHPWSGLDPERLGAKTATYAGRGRVTIADRRRTATEGGSA
jgi:preprotein translocase subunit SecD